LDGEGREIEFFGTRERAGKLKEGESFFFFLNEREGNRKETKETKRPSKR